MAVYATSFAFKCYLNKIKISLPVILTALNLKNSKLQSESNKMSAENSPAPIQKSSCIFCNIVNKLENTEILFEDEDVCVFRDIKPASDYHILTIPKRHIDDVKSLTAPDKELITKDLKFKSSSNTYNIFEKMLNIAKELLAKNNLSIDDARFGYHWPPFRSIKHLHLHTIAPESKMGFIGNMIFKKNSYWFVSPEYVASRL